MSNTPSKLEVSEDPLQERGVSHGRSKLRRNTARGRDKARAGTGRGGGAAGCRGGPGSSVPALRVIAPKQSMDSLLKEVGAARATPLPGPGDRGAARG